MNNRIFTVALIATIVSLSSGCSGMRNFMFGRGARCGLCNRGAAPAAPAPQFGNTMQAPCGPPACNQPYAAPAQNCCPDPYVQPYASGGYSCGSCGSPSAGDCGCGYGYVDPYTNSIPSGAVGVPSTGQPMGNVAPMAPVQPDDFSARRFDNDGSRIIWEEPAYGGTAL